MKPVLESVVVKFVHLGGPVHFVLEVEGLRRLAFRHSEALSSIRLLLVYAAAGRSLVYGAVEVLLCYFRTISDTMSSSSEGQRDGRSIVTEKVGPL